MDLVKRSKEMNEFFKLPELYIKRDQLVKFNAVKHLLPEFEDITANDKMPSITIVFKKLTDREKACDILAENGIRYRTGKTLTPFRLTGNLDWGVNCPEIEGVKNQTFYVWPESLWAPISFTKTYLKSKLCFQRRIGIIILFSFDCSISRQVLF